METDTKFSLELLITTETHLCVLQNTTDAHLHLPTTKTQQGNSKFRQSASGTKLYETNDISCSYDHIGIFHHDTACLLLDQQITPKINMPFINYSWIAKFSAFCCFHFPQGLHRGLKSQSCLLLYQTSNSYPAFPSDLLIKLQESIYNDKSLKN